MSRMTGRNRANWRANLSWVARFPNEDRVRCGPKTEPDRAFGALMKSFAVRGANNCSLTSGAGARTIGAAFVGFNNSVIQFPQIGSLNE